ncbi:hypothetical protein KM176_10320 [Pseudooceanicola sp. CBS1P-1]|uniref:Phage gp6-like head-tail connector protein n=1 Tax=Pseudooceanicola albus TaxID=2692189 RepID=A0A6L7GDK8_9RHOB|nr:MULTISPECIES: hypothetical protein [Pseudooceanicola]MBT9384251.1 hypothetical protein [Pseudooceanicola endophyticus]MXN20843.1 hypothetical protein [Pseudooceanicola albus]
MLLVEINQVASTLLPIEAFRDHLRLGSGFAEDGLQDGVLEAYLRAAIAALEGRTGQAFLQRDFIWTLEEWSDPEGVRVPVTPVRFIQEVRIYEDEATYSAITGDEFRITADSYFPVFRRTSGLLPTIPDNGKAEVLMTAGAATEWAVLPGDLAQAVLLLAAHYYEYRNDPGLSRGCMPFGVTALIERYRPIRLGKGIRA